MIWVRKFLASLILLAAALTGTASAQTSFPQWKMDAPGSPLECTYVYSPRITGNIQSGCNSAYGATPAVSSNSYDVRAYITPANVSDYSTAFNLACAAGVASGKPFEIVNPIGTWIYKHTMGCSVGALSVRVTGHGDASSLVADPTLITTPAMLFTGSGLSFDNFQLSGWYDGNGPCPSPTQTPANCPATTNGSVTRGAVGLEIGTGSSNVRIQNLYVHNFNDHDIIALATNGMLIQSNRVEYSFNGAGILVSEDAASEHVQIVDNHVRFTQLGNIQAFNPLNHSIIAHNVTQGTATGTGVRGTGTVADNITVYDIYDANPTFGLTVSDNVGIDSGNNCMHVGPSEGDIHDNACFNPWQAGIAVYRGPNTGSADSNIVKLHHNTVIWPTNPTNVFIGGITNANPGVVTTTSPHGYFDGQTGISIAGVLGMTGANGTGYTVHVIDSTHFSFGVDTSGFGTYTSGGTIAPNVRNGRAYIIRNYTDAEVQGNSSKNATYHLEVNGIPYTAAISGITNATLGVVTTTTPNLLTDGQTGVVIAGVVGMTGVNGTYTVHVLTPTTFTFGVNTTASGTYVSGGTVTAPLALIGVTNGFAKDEIVEGDGTNMVCAGLWRNTVNNFTVGGWRIKGATTKFCSDQGSPSITYDNDNWAYGSSTPAVLGAAYGTAAAFNTGTSGGAVPLMSTTNAWAGSQTFNAGLITSNQACTITGISTFAGATFTAPANPPCTYYLTAPLTANAIVTLTNGSSAWEVTYVRAASSTGAFNWAIGSLKNLAPGTWVTLRWAGAWLEIASGSL